MPFLRAIAIENEQYQMTPLNREIQGNVTQSEISLKFTSQVKTLKTMFTINHIWVGGPIGKPSTSINLFKNGKLQDTIVINEKDGWSYRWKNLEIFDHKGERNVYTVGQVNVPQGYEEIVHGYVITNRFIKTTGNIIVSVMNIWRNAPLVKPSVPLQLYQNGSAYGDVAWVHNGQFEFMWFNLPSHDAWGNPFTYTIKVVEIPIGYHVTYEGNIIVYTFIGGGYKQDTTEGHGQGSNRIFDPNNPIYQDENGNHLPKGGISDPKKYLYYGMIIGRILSVIESQKKKNQTK